MLEESVRDLRKGTDGFKAVTICRPSRYGEEVSYIYLVATKDRYYLVFDSGYEGRYIHIHEEKVSISFSELKKKFPEKPPECFNYRKWLILKLVKIFFSEELTSSYIFCDTCEEVKLLTHELKELCEVLCIE